jgi:hypothetical protein
MSLEYCVVEGGTRSKRLWMRKERKSGEDLVKKYK